MKDPRYFRHPKLDVEVSLARVESMIRGKEDGSFVRVGNSPLMGGGMAHADVWNVKADVWNVKVLLEELRAQLEEQNPRPPKPEDPVVAEALEGLTAWLEEQHLTRETFVELFAGSGSRYGIAHGVLAEVLRKAVAGNAAPEKAGTITVDVRPEVDREALGDLASDLAEAVVSRLADRMNSGPNGIVPSADFDLEHALELAVQHHGHQGTADRVVLATAREFRAHLAGLDLPISVEDLDPLVKLTSTPVEDRDGDWHLSMEHALSKLVGQAERGSRHAE